MALFEGDGTALAGIPGFGFAKDIKASKANEAERKKVEAANRQLMEAMAAASGAYGQRRGDMASMQGEAARNIIGMYQPANEMMREMTGGMYGMDLDMLQRRMPNFAMAGAAGQGNPQGGTIQRPASGAAPAAPGWGSVGGTAAPAVQRDPYQSAVDARIRGTQSTPPSIRGGR